LRSILELSVCKENKNDEKDKIFGEKKINFIRNYTFKRVKSAENNIFKRIKRLKSRIFMRLIRKWLVQNDETEV